MRTEQKRRTVGTKRIGETLEVNPDRTQQLTIPGVVRRGRKQMQKVLYISQRSSVIGYDPRVALSWLIRRSLRARKPPDCIIYDAAGNKIAVMDGETGERKNA